MTKKQPKLPLSIAPKAQILFKDVSQALFPDDPVEAQVNRMKIDILKAIKQQVSSSVKPGPVAKLLGITRKKAKLLQDGRVDAFQLGELIGFSVTLGEATGDGGVRFHLHVSMDTIYD